MKRYWRYIVESTEKRVEAFLRAQVNDPDRSDRGRMDSDVVEGKPTIYMLTDALCLYFVAESRYYKDAGLFAAVERGVSFVEGWQRSDGSLDFPSCNFHSAPDTAFCFRRLYGAREILKKHAASEAEKALEQRFLRLLLRCIPIMVCGGFHTPNHRWAVLSALLCMEKLVEENGELALSEADFTECGFRREPSADDSCGEAAGRAARRLDVREAAAQPSDEQGEAVRRADVREAELCRLDEQGETARRLDVREAAARPSDKQGQEFGAEELLEKIRTRAKQYLAEGIDGDADGEYAERSTGNYNAVVDKCLVTAYEMTGDESYLGYVERNLDMMLYYFDGDDTIFTQNSTRQDQGKAMYPDSYFYLYTYMAAHLSGRVAGETNAGVNHTMPDRHRPTSNLHDAGAERTAWARFDAAAHKIIKDSMERGDLAPDCMYIFEMYDRLKEYAFQGYGFLTQYRRYFPGSQVLRVKKPAYGCSVLSGKPQFLFVKFGSLQVSMRIGEAYCDVRYFLPQELQNGEDGCVLRAAARGWYYEPWAANPGTADWWAMDHGKRERVITSRTDITVTIKELERGVAVTVKAEGLSGLPLRVELMVPAGSILETDSVRLTAHRGGSLILRDGYLHLHNGGRKLLIGPGYGVHSFQGHYSGEEKNEAGYSIYLNDYTPYERTFYIEDETAAGLF